jgi:hypothetical protein
VVDQEKKFPKTATLLGNGLIFQHSIGTIGILGGWYWYGETSDYERVLAGNESLDWQNDPYFSLVPVINTAKIPVIGLLFSVYEGLFGNNQGEFYNNFSHKLVSRCFDLGEISIQ